MTRARMGRRGFGLGLGSLLLGAPVRADVLSQGKLLKDEAKDRKAPNDLPYTPLEQIPNHRQLMRDIVIALSAYAKKRDPRFLVLVRNGPELLVKEKREYSWETLRDPDGAAEGKYMPTGTINRPFLRAIDGMLIDGLFFGEEAYGKPTNADTGRLLMAAAEALVKEGRHVLSIEYCAVKEQMEEAASRAAKAGALAYVDADGDKALGRIPPGRPPRENPAEIHGLGRARNFLPMLDSNRYATRADWVNALAATNYDLLILDAFWHQSESLLGTDIRTLRYKRLGADRLVFADLPLGLARDTRFYWQPDWRPGKPAFLVAPDPADPSEIVVTYWDDKWKAIVGRYMQGIMDLGVAGVVLDQVDAYLWFEARMPLE